jgi:peptide/nickel transport system substrate-binding protein
MLESNDPGRLDVREITRSRFLRNSAGAALSLTTLGALIGCGSGSEGTTTAAAGTGAVGKRPTTPTGTLRVALPAAPFSLDPAVTATQGDRAIVRTVFDGLVEYDPTYTQLRPALAESWTDHGAREWIINIRPNVTFHDGEALDSTALKANFKHFQNGSLSRLFMPAKFTALDDSHPLVLRVAMPEAYPDFMRNQILLGLISPASIAKGTDAINKHPVGAGAYRFASYRADQLATLEANPHYWGAGPYFEKIEFQIIVEESSRINAALTGKIDLDPKVTPTQLTRLKGNKSVKEVGTDAWSGVFVVPRVDSAPFSDENARKALAYAIDAQGIIASVVRGQATAADSMAPRSTIGYAEPQTKYTYDPAKAKSLLARAGQTGKGQVKLLVSSAQYLGPQISQAVAAQLEAVGFSVKLDIVDPTIQGREFGSPNSRYNLFVTDYYWLTGGPFIQAYVPFVTHYTGRDLDTAWHTVQTTPDGPARETACAAWEELRASKALLLPIFHSRFVDTCAANLQGYSSPKDGFMPILAPTYVPQAA